jgi:DNA-binding CsgD family transcriptional regulator
MPGHEWFSTRDGEYPELRREPDSVRITRARGVGGIDSDLVLRLGVRGYLSKSQPCDDVVAAVRVVAMGGTLLGSLSSPPPDGTDNPPLTVREREVLHLLLAGLRNRDIARQLQIAAHTVDFHVRNLLAKHGVHSRWELRRRYSSGSQIAGQNSSNLQPPLGARGVRQDRQWRPCGNRWTYR